MSLQGGFQEENVVFNEERLFEKIPFFQGTTPKAEEHHIIPCGSGWEDGAEPAGPDSDAA